MRYRYLAALIVVAVLYVPTLAAAGPDLARKVSQALRIAKAADARSKQALAAVPTLVKGDAGATGERGAEGPQGAIGRAGVDGAAGANGTNGTNGARGEKGEPGQDGSLRVRTATNAAVVRLGASGAMTDAYTVAETTVSADRSSLALVTANGQVASVKPNAGTPPGATPVTCSLDVDGAVVETREFDLAAGATQLVTVQGAVPLGVGSHHVAFVCARANGMTDAVAEFAAGRTRLSVVSGG